MSGPYAPPPPPPPTVSSSLRDSSQEFWIEPQCETDYDVFITNLPYEMTESEIEVLFSQVGVVDRVTIRTDRHSGRSRGMGTVTYVAAESTVLAVETLNGVLVKGRPIRVNSTYALKVKRNASTRNIDLGGTEKADPSIMQLDSKSLQQDPHGSTSPTNGEAESALTEEVRFRQRFVDGLNGNDFIQLLKHVQDLAREHPILAAKILKETPSMLFAVLHGISIVDSNIFNSLKASQQPAGTSPSTSTTNNNNNSEVETTSNLINPEISLKMKQIIEEYKKECQKIENKVEKLNDDISILTYPKKDKEDDDSSSLEDV